MTDIEELYRIYFRDVYLYAMRLSHDEHLAEEIVSETFFKAMQSLERFRGGCDIRVWLCQIAKNAYYSHLRREKRLVPLEETAERPVCSDVEDSVSDAEQSSKIYAVLHGLKEPYKEVFTLRVLGELSFRRIGELFGKTENWACVTYHRAKAKIREQMEAES